MPKLPSISIVSPMYNCNLVLFRKSLESIKRQDYPKELLEHIKADGGSQNDSVKLAKAYGCKVIERPDLRDYSQVRMSLAIQKAVHELVLILEPDNILVGKYWLREMVQPFVENKTIFCTFSMHTSYTKDMPAIAKYCSLFGTSDAPAGYLGKIERVPCDEEVYKKGEILKELPSYYIVRFTKDNLPTLGDNGHMVRKIAIDKVNKKPKTFIHTDAFAAMQAYGYDTVGVVKNSIIHYTDDSIMQLYKRRVSIKQRFLDGQRKKRLHLVFDYHSLHDWTKITLFMLLAVTFVGPFLRSCKGYLKIREPAWFLHPIICFVSFLMYTRSEFSLFGFLILKRLRKI